MARLSANRGLAAAVLAFTALTAAPAQATVFYSRSEIPRLAFPDAERVESKTFFLEPGQRRRIEELAHAPLDSNLIEVRIGRRGGRDIGYAFVDSHIVRTLPETLLVVLDSGGAVRAVHVLAFHEPSEYAPSHRWLEQLSGAASPAPLRLGRGITGITGATLSSRAVAAATRRALALYAVLLEGGS